jgi:hypothetical protein
MRKWPVLSRSVQQPRVAQTPHRRQLCANCWLQSEYPWRIARDDASTFLSQNPEAPLPEFGDPADIASFHAPKKGGEDEEEDF